jgi:hypothetical protein
MSYATGVCLFEEEQDMDPPEITDGGALPRIVAPGSDVLITANIVDSESGVAEADATVRDSLGAVVTTLAMSPAGGDSWSAVLDTSGSPDDLCTVDITAEDASSNANSTTSVSAASFEIRSGYSCDIVLTDETVTGSEEWEACGSISAGPTFLVDSSGDARIIAGSAVVLRNGFTVESNGRLELSTDPTLN